MQQYEQCEVSVGHTWEKTDTKVDHNVQMIAGNATCELFALFSEDEN